MNYHSIGHIKSIRGLNLHRATGVGQPVRNLAGGSLGTWFKRAYSNVKNYIEKNPLANTLYNAGKSYVQSTPQYKALDSTYQAIKRGDGDRALPAAETAYKTIKGNGYKPKYGGEIYTKAQLRKQVKAFLK